MHSMSGSPIIVRPVRFTPSMPGLPTGRAGMSLHMSTWMLARLGLALGHSTILALLACCRSRFGLFIS